MEYLRSSQTARITSCSLRCMVRSWVRNRFLASCCVMVEPPCDTPRCSTLARGRARDAERIDAPVRIEAPVLDRQERLRQERRQLAQRNRRAAHLAARREHAAVEADDLDRGRTLRNFERLDRRQVRGDPPDHADHADEAPQAEHERPIGDAADQRTARALAPSSCAARLSFSRDVGSRRSSLLRFAAMPTRLRIRGGPLRGQAKGRGLMHG